MATLQISRHDIAKMIDHSLLHPTMTDADIVEGLRIARKYGVATACIKPYLIPLAAQELAGCDVRLCPVIGFPHGSSTTASKVFEADEAAAACANFQVANTAQGVQGPAEIDMVINIGKALGGDWEYVRREVAAVNTAVLRHGAVLKVIFENDYLDEATIVRLCQICSDVGVAFVKTSTGYGFVKQAETGLYSYAGATLPHLRLMRQNSTPAVQIKAAGGVRTLDDLLRVRSLGVTRIGATATAAILDEAERRGIPETDRIDVAVPPMEEGVQVQNDPAY